MKDFKNLGKSVRQIYDFVDKIEISEENEWTMDKFLNKRRKKCFEELFLSIKDKFLSSSRPNDYSEGL